MRENFKSRSTDLDDPIGILCPPPRFFSTHYSNSASVLWYLIRLEPFTSLHIFLQDGKFDRPDRQFWSMKNTYNGCTTNDGDVKELIPEFFYLPDLLRNCNHLNLGVRQDAVAPIDDVQLPPWAKTPEEFIRINRDALESEYVSMNLPKWIDLVFGYRQRGVDAEASFNLFSHVSYYGSLDMEKLLRDDPPRFSEAASMLENFGQTPLMLFSIPHKNRKPLFPVPPLPLFSYRDWLSSAGCRHLGAGTCVGENAYPKQSLAVYKTSIHLSSPILALHSAKAASAVLALGLDRSLWLNPVKASAGHLSPFDIGVDPRLKNGGSVVVGEPFSPQLAMTQPDLAGDQLVAVMHSGQYMCMAGSWDNALKIVNTTTGAVELSIASGQDVVTCVCVSEDDSLVVTGSQDNSVVVYTLDYSSGAPRLVSKKTLFGHDGAVTCVAVNKKMGLMCSGSEDGTIIVYSLSSTMYLRTIFDPDFDKKLSAMPAVSWCDVTNEGNIVWYSKTDFKFHMYSLLGEKLFEKEMNSQLNSICLSNDRQYVLAAGDKIAFFLMRLADFVVVTGAVEERYGGEGVPASFAQVGMRGELNGRFRIFT